MKTGSMGAAERMDRIYRTQRLFYDVTRRPYLLGRDRLLKNLLPPACGHVLEIGCGTARNLIRAADLYPSAHFYGLDVSSEMLTTAAHAVARRRLGDRIRLAHADATTCDPAAIFGIHRFDRIFIAYALSMIPAWQAVLERAEGLLTPSGSLHIADFGQCDELPAAFRRVLFAWLARFSVAPQAELDFALIALAASRHRRLTLQHHYRGYALHAVLGRA